MSLDARHSFALKLADEAATLALSHFERRHELHVESKGLQDFVTLADRDVESLLRQRLRENFPDDAVLGEEQGRSGPETAPALWVVDPIDGTTNFLHGLPHWGVTIALYAEGDVQLGVIAAPVFRELYVARKGRGTTCNEKPIQVSRTTELRSALIGFGSSKKSPQAPYVKALDGLLAQGIEYRRLGCASMNLAAVASGRLDAFFEARLSPWDALAGMLLVSEAGGRCNPYLPKGLTQPNTVLVSTPALYPSLVAGFDVAES